MRYISIFYSILLTIALPLSSASASKGIEGIPDRYYTFLEYSNISDANKADSNDYLYAQYTLFARNHKSLNQAELQKYSYKNLSEVLTVEYAVCTEAPVTDPSEEGKTGEYSFYVHSNSKNSFFYYEWEERVACILHTKNKYSTNVLNAMYYETSESCCGAIIISAGGKFYGADETTLVIAEDKDFVVDYFCGNAPSTNMLLGMAGKILINDPLKFTIEGEDIKQDLIEQKTALAESHAYNDYSNTAIITNVLFRRGNEFIQRIIFNKRSEEAAVAEREIFEMQKNRTSSNTMHKRTKKRLENAMITRNGTVLNVEIVHSRKKIDELKKIK